LGDQTPTKHIKGGHPPINPQDTSIGYPDDVLTTYFSVAEWNSPVKREKS